MAEPRVVIVGGGQAGGQVALSLREGGHAGALTIVAAEPWAPYERPPLSKELLTGQWDPGRLALAAEEALAAQGIVLRKGVAAVAIDPERRRLRLADGEDLAWDALVLATGARPRVLAAQPGAPRLHRLRDLEDALALREALRPGARLAILGGGVIGLELAASAIARGVAPVVIEAAPRVMARQVGPGVSARLQALHAGRGTVLHLGRRLEGAPEAAGGGLVLRLDDGSTIAADAAVAAIGVVPETALAEAAGLRCEDGICVDAAGRTSHPGIWATGDVARHPAAWAPGGSFRQETWRHADAHARVVARSILGEEAAYDEVPGFWSDQFGHRLQAEGLAADEEILRDDPAGPGFAAFHLAGGRLAGAVVLDNPKLAGLARRAIAAGTPVAAAALADPAADLRRILR